MAIPLLALSLKCKRDLLRLRQLTRHAAQLLGFDPADQACLAAAAFDLACQSHAQTGRACACLDIVDDRFRVLCTPLEKSRQHQASDKQPPFQLGMPLPAAATVLHEDVPWMLQQLADLAPLDLFEEMRKVNQDLLQLLLERPAQIKVTTSRADPSAA